MIYFKFCLCAYQMMNSQKCIEKKKKQRTFAIVALLISLYNKCLQFARNRRNKIISMLQLDVALRSSSTASLKFLEIAPFLFVLFALEFDTSATVLLRAWFLKVHSWHTSPVSLDPATASYLQENHHFYTQ